MTSLQGPERKKIPVVAPTNLPIGGHSRTILSDPERESTTRTILICSFLLLIALVLGIFIFLPAAIEARLTEERQNQAIAQKNPGASDQVIKSGKSPTPPVAEIGFKKETETKNKIKAEKILGHLLNLQETLHEKAVSKWGGAQYSKLLDITKTGDNAFHEQQFSKAATLYAQGVNILEELETVLPERLEQVIKEGDAALTLGNGVVAQQHFTLALTMDPSNDYVRRNLSRAAHIEQVFKLLKLAKEHETQQRFKQSLTDYKNAASIDPDSELAQSGIDRVHRIIVEQNFNKIMSRGFDALNLGNFSKAKKAFQKARTIKPASKEINEALNQANEGLKIENITVNKQKAMAAERHENWQTATDHYASVLALDPDVLFAQQGKKRSEQFLQVNQQLDYYLKKPSRLYSKDPLVHAQKLLSFANSLENPGNKLTKKLSALATQIKQAQTPISIKLISDNATEVVIYKVGKLGTFSTQELMLRRGTYTVVGTRPGYRDIRKQIIVDGNPGTPPFPVRCEERI